MKKLTSLAVLSTMDLLIHTNKTTSTLEVKEVLRNLGYYAEQKEVSILMRENVLQNPESYVVNDNGYHLVYSWDEDTNDDYFNFGFAKDIDDDSDDSDDFSSITRTIDDVINNLEEPENAAYTIDGIEDLLDSNDIDLEDWAVFCTDDNEPYLIFSGTMTRDRVRTRYSSLQKVRIQDVRAKRIKNIL